MQKPNPALQLKEYKLIIPMLRLLSNSTATTVEIHQRYGELVMVNFFGKRVLFICKPEHIEQLFSQEAKGMVSRDALYEAKKPLFGDGLVNGKDKQWTSQRKLMQPFFNKDAVNAWFDIYLEDAEELVQKLISFGQGEANITQEFKSLIQGIFIKLLFGRQSAVSRNPIVGKALDTIIKYLAPELFAEMLGNKYLKLAFALQHRKVQLAIVKFKDFIRQVLADENNMTNDGLISILSRAQDRKSGYRMSDTMLMDEAITLFLAGQDTTVNTLVWFFYLLGQNEAVQSKIADEIAQYIDEKLSAETLAKHCYTNAALHETMRLYPGVAGVTKQCIVDGIQFDSYSIPKDTTVFVSIYATQQNAKLWQNPVEFYPEHFSDPGLSTRRHRFAYLPFSGGMHNCIGRHLAELEMMVIIVNLLRAFSFRTEMTVKKAVSVTIKPDRDVIMKLNPKV